MQCKICHLDNAHKLDHYLKDCTIIEKFRGSDDNIRSDFEKLTEIFLNVDLLEKIISEHKDFASSF